MKAPLPQVVMAAEIDLLWVLQIWTVTLNAIKMYGTTLSSIIKWSNLWNLISITSLSYWPSLMKGRVNVQNGGIDLFLKGKRRGSGLLTLHCSKKGGGRDLPVPQMTWLEKQWLALYFNTFCLITALMNTEILSGKLQSIGKMSWLLLDCVLISYAKSWERRRRKHFLGEVASRSKGKSQV